MTKAHPYRTGILALTAALAFSACNAPAATSSSRSATTAIAVMARPGDSAAATAAPNGAVSIEDRAHATICEASIVGTQPLTLVTSRECASAADPSSVTLDGIGASQVVESAEAPAAASAVVIFTEQDSRRLGYSAESLSAPTAICAAQGCAPEAIALFKKAAEQGADLSALGSN